MADTALEKVYCCTQPFCVCQVAILVLPPRAVATSRPARRKPPPPPPTQPPLLLLLTMASCAAVFIKDEPPSPDLAAAAATHPGATFVKHEPPPVVSAAEAPDLSPPPGNRSPPPSPAPFASPSPPHPSSGSSSRRFHCWSHDETLALIDAYRDKWCALRGGKLRVSHWQDVADYVNRRCSTSGAGGSATALKTFTQCRAKVDKLRRRYHDELHKSLRCEPSLPPASHWIYFGKMDVIERSGGAPAAERRGLRSRVPSSYEEKEQQEEEEEENEEDLNRPYLRCVPSGSGVKTHGTHGLVANGVGTTVARDEMRAAASSTAKLPNQTSPLFKRHGDGGARQAMENMRRKLDLGSFLNDTLFKTLETLNWR